ncbi:DUF6443 domain-containing protein [Chryseobacterium sp. MMS23-Vi53]|uniref:DUF6443 domain-containing protein n=1 Tax=Chryseobacterium sp. MMS23-Vi53 TaxID=3386644 RepID=UPI0039ECD977
MKKILIPISLLFVSGLISAQATNTENYIRSRTYLESVIDSSNTAKQIQTVQYFDGLGKPKQIVNVKASPTGKDLVTTIPYDTFGRQVDSWLPTPMSTLNGGMQSGVESTAQTYYNDTKAFSHKNLENSPIDRILSQVQPGTSWQGNPIQFGYTANVNGEVKKYIATFDYPTFTSNIFLSTNGYASGELYKNTVTDEDGNATIEFKNNEGQIILLRKVISATEYADTYYVYNDYNQLAYVISPLASVANTIDTATLNNLCFQYKYDGKNRLVEKKLPGKGWEYMVYDKQDRLVLTQDANLGVSKQWLFTKYDQYGRSAYTGIYTSLQNYGSAGRAIEQTNVDSKGSNNVARLTTIGFTSNGLDVYYNNEANNSYPSSITKLLGVNYYDKYPPYLFNSPFPPSILNEPTLTDAPAVSESRSTKGLPVMNIIKNIENDNWTKNYIYYDKKGKVIGNYSINHLGGRTRVDSKLDFAGIVQQTVTTHKRLDSDIDKVITENFTYDHQNRLLTHTHQVDNNSVEYLTQNTYNELSQITNKKVGGTTASTPVQDIAYNYNIRGWMTKMNDPANLSGKLFGYEIKYTNPVYTSLTSGNYNGNISEIDWKTSKDNILKRYSYQYDPLSRLKKGIYTEPNASIPQNDYYNETIDYDVNGNISFLKRNRKLDNVGVQLMDDLTYIYSGNRLNTVTDNSSNYFGYPEASGNLIHYDDNGNMINHIDKGILEIKYNYLNLPNYIKFDQYVMREDPFGFGLETKYKNTVYQYRADGVKLIKVHNYFTGRTQLDAATTTEYLDGFQYSSESGLNGHATLNLQFVPTSEGYFDFLQNKYIYQYKDQVGNIRLAYYKDSNGNPKIDRTTDYYPFGLEFGGSLIIAGSLTPTYTYSQQEQEKQLDTGWSSFKWRNYDPTMGRFFTADPLSEKYNYQSHYNFSENRVIDGRELEGLEWVASQDVGSKVVNSVYSYRLENNTIGALTNGQLSILAKEREAQLRSVAEGKDSAGNQLNIIFNQSNDATIVWEYNMDYDWSKIKGADKLDSNTMTQADVNTLGLTEVIGDTQNNRVQINVGLLISFPWNNEGQIVFDSQEHRAKMAKTGAHEDLHVAGQRHENKKGVPYDSSNIMYESSSGGHSGTKFTLDQRAELIKLILNSTKKNE